MNGMNGQSAPNTSFFASSYFSHILPDGNLVKNDFVPKVTVAKPAVEPTKVDPPKQGRIAKFFSDGWTKVKNQYNGLQTWQKPLYVAGVGLLAAGVALGIGSTNGMLLLFGGVAAGVIAYLGTESNHSPFK